MFDAEVVVPVLAEEALQHNHVLLIDPITPTVPAHKVVVVNIFFITADMVAIQLAGMG